MLGYSVWIPSLGVCSFAFDWRYDCGTAVVPLVYTSLREYSVVRSAPNGVTPLVTDLDDVIYRAGVEHFDFKGSRERIVADTRAALEAIAKIKLCAILDGETATAVRTQPELPFARTEELH